MTFRSSPMESSPTVQLPLLDWREIQLHTPVLLDMNCLVIQWTLEYVSLIEHGVEGSLLVQVRFWSLRHVCMTVAITSNNRRCRWTWMYLSCVVYSFAVVDCNMPPTINDGSRMFTTTTYQSTATYSCNNGYILTGSPTVTCLASGSWSTRPTCTGM